MSSELKQRPMSKRTTNPVAVISSTAREMPEHLRVALDVCLRLGMIPVMVEHPAAGTLDAVEASLSMVDNADIYIGIFGERYGYVPAGYDKSISEMEYDRASERGIPRLVFTSGLRFPPDAAAFETTHELVRPKAFLDRLRQQQIVSEAESAQEFRTLLIAGLTALGIRREARKTESKPRTLDAGERKKGGADGDAKSTRRKVTPAKNERDVLRLFVASPRDVQEERSRMPKVVESLNRTLGKLLNVVIELWRWAADAPPGVGEPQALIDPELDDADVVLVIFWNRFGTPASNGVTGTQ